jgi:hypothetical protein
MKLQEHVIVTTQKAAEEVFRFAKAVPEERVDWQPLSIGHSVLDLARELAKTPDWAYETISSDSPPSFNEEEFAAQKQEMES